MSVYMFLIILSPLIMAIILLMIYGLDDTGNNPEV